jgi:hypothetical protein
MKSLKEICCGCKRKEIPKTDEGAILMLKKLLLCFFKQTREEEPPRPETPEPYIDRLAVFIEPET